MEAEPCHAEKEPAVAEAGDVSFAVGAVFITHWDVADTEVQEGGAKE